MYEYASREKQLLDLDGQKKYPIDSIHWFQGISFVVLNLKEGYSNSNVWLFSLGFVVRAFFA